MQQCKNSALKYWLIICIAILIAFISSKAKADEEYSELHYIIIDDEVEITGLADYSISKLVIPDTIEGLTVTSISGCAFEYCDSLTSITIPDSVTSIGDYAFKGCVSLTSITIPDSVTSIGESTFNVCESLTSITIPDSVTSIGDYAFADCTSLRSITIPDSVTSIGDDAFRWCASLTSITIPDSVTSIGTEAFMYCESLTSITIPDSVTSIGDYAFSDCSSLTSITIPDSVTYIGSYAFYSYKIEYVIILSADTNYEEDSFYDGSILIYAYNHKFNEGEVIAPTKYSDGYTLYTCSDCDLTYKSDYVESLDTDDDNENYEYSEYSGLYYTIDDDQITITGLADDSITELEIPNYIEGLPVTAIYDEAFKECRNIITVTIPDSVTSIGAGAFWFCENLTSIVIPDGVTKIEDHTFLACYELENVIIPNSVTYIGDSAFGYCWKLTDLIIPNSVIYIGDGAFYDCVSLNDLAIPNSVTSINPLTFQESSIKSITIPDSVVSIGDQAFYDTSGLVTITIPASVTTIGSYAFSECSDLTEIIFESCATTIPDDAFYGSEKLKNIVIKHKEVTDKAVAATCTKSGLTAGTHCSVCNEVLTAQKTVAALGHNYSKKVTKATYKAKGYTTYTCSRCGYSYNSDYTNMLTLAKPTVKVANTSTGVKVTWSKTTGASGYIVYRKTGSGTWTTLKTITSGSTVSYTDTTAKAGTTYYYTVRAYVGSTTTYKSSYVTNVSIKYLKQPTVTLSNAASGVKVSWSKTTGASGYYVYRKTASGSWSRIKTVTSVGTTSYTDTTAKAGTTYYYTVKAYSGSTYSSYVTNKTIKRLTQPVVTLSKVTKGVKVAWKKITGASGYYVYRKTASGSWSRIKTITSASTLSYTDTTGKNGTTYYYTVKAYSGSINSSYVTNKSIKYKK
jgi:hypothetical protein